LLFGSCWHRAQITKVGHILSTKKSPNSGKKYFDEREIEWRIFTPRDNITNQTAFLPISFAKKCKHKLLVQKSWALNLYNKSSLKNIGELKPEIFFIIL